MKKLLPILFLLFLCFVSYSQTKITAPLITNSITDTTYSVTYDSLVKGGYRTLATKVQRDSIPVAERKYGMLVYVSDKDTCYQLKDSSLSNSNWYGFKFSSGQLYTAGTDIKIVGDSINADTTTGYTKLATQGYVLRNGGGGTNDTNYLKIGGQSLGHSLSYGTNDTGTVIMKSNNVARFNLDKNGTFYTATDYYKLRFSAAGDIIQGSAGNSELYNLYADLALSIPSDTFHLPTNRTPDWDINGHILPQLGSKSGRMYFRPATTSQYSADSSFKAIAFVSDINSSIIDTNYLRIGGQSIGKGISFGTNDNKNDTILRNGTAQLIFYGDQLLKNRDNNFGFNGNSLYANNFLFNSDTAQFYLSNDTFHQATNVYHLNAISFKNHIPYYNNGYAWKTFSSAVNTGWGILSSIDTIYADSSKLLPINDSNYRYITPTYASNNLVPYIGSNKNVNLGTNGLYTDFTQFTTTPTSVDSTARLVWNNTYGTLNLTYGDGVTINQVGQQLDYSPCVNKTGSTLNYGTLVMVNPSNAVQGNRLNIQRMISNGTYPVTLMVGIVTNTILNNGTGYVCWFGDLLNINNSAINLNSETWNEGDILYADPAHNGGLTNILPTAPSIKTTVALIKKISGSNIDLLVRPTLTPNLNSINNVNISSPSNGSVLAYDSANARWYNKNSGNGTLTSIATGIGLLGGTITSSGTISSDTTVLLPRNDSTSTKGYITPTALTNKNYITLNSLSATKNINTSVFTYNNVTGAYNLDTTRLSSGTITGVTAGIDLTGGGTSGTVTINADTSTGATKLATQGFVTRNATTLTANLPIKITSNVISADTGRGNTQLATGYDLNKVRDSLTTVTPQLAAVNTFTTANYFKSIWANKDSIPITTGKTWGLVEDTATGQLKRQILTSGGTPSGSTGYVQFNYGSNFAGSPNLFYDSTNKYLGIGGSSPLTNLHIFGTNTGAGTSASGQTAIIQAANYPVLQFKHGTTNNGLIGYGFNSGTSGASDLDIQSGGGFGIAINGSSTRVLSISTAGVVSFAISPNLGSVANVSNSWTVQNGSLNCNFGKENNPFGSGGSSTNLGIWSANNLSLSAGTFAGTFANENGLMLFANSKRTAFGSQTDDGVNTIQVNGSAIATKYNIGTGLASSSAGTSTLVSGTVTVNTTAATTNSIILIQRKSVNGSTALGSMTYSVVNGTSFTVTAVQASSPATTETNDNSIFVYQIIN